MQDFILTWDLDPKRGEYVLGYGVQRFARSAHGGSGRWADNALTNLSTRRP